MAKLPCKECGGRCCTFPPFSEQELDKVKAVHAMPDDSLVLPFGMGTQKKFFTVIKKDDENGTCGFFKNNQCSIYNERPLTCKIYGESDQLPCEYLHPEKANRIAERLYRRVAPLFK